MSGEGARRFGVLLAVSAAGSGPCHGPLVMLSPDDVRAIQVYVLQLKESASREAQ